MQKRYILCIAVLVFITSLLPAGDIAMFVNLGFSGNSKYFMFGQYGIKEKESVAFSDLFLIDVPQNTFVPNGSLSGSYKIDLQPGQDGSGALYTLLTANAELGRKYGIDHLKQGRFLYIFVNGEPPKSQLEFRDFITGKTYRVNLIQSTQGSGTNISSSFYIQLSIIEKDGGIKAYTVGHPKFMRDKVKQYRIKQVVLAPDGSSLIFVVEKETIDGEGTNIRYMVETVSIQ